MKRATLLVIGACLLFPTMSAARDYGLGIRAGTQGIGAEGAVEFKKWLTLRAGLYGGSYSDDFEEGDIDYDGELTVGGVGVLADFFPTGGKFRLTAGMFQNDNEIDFDSTPTAPIEIGDSIYSPAQIGTLDGAVEFDSSAPYFGIGYGNVADGNGRVGFLFDVGALLQGSPDVSLARTSTIPAPGLDQDLQAEVAEIEDDIEQYDIWPVISFGVAIRF